MAASYRSVAAPAAAEVVERKSRFIGQVRPVSSEEEAFSFLEEVRSANPEARHNVWAYLLQNGRERCSDDGEPQKTAGLPTLEVLRRSGLADLALVTTRYFGGVLLGTGGLVRAYTAAAQEALAAARTVEFTSCVDVACRVPYPLFEQVRRMAADAGGSVGEPSFTHEVLMPVLFKEGDELPFIAAVGELSRGERLCEVGPARFCAFPAEG